MAPLVEASDEETGFWTRYRTGDVDANTLKMLLTKVYKQARISFPFVPRLPCFGFVRHAYFQELRYAARRQARAQPGTMCKFEATVSLSGFLSRT